MATKKFVPRGDNEGGIGDFSRRWKEVHAATGSFYNGLSGSLQTLTDGTSSMPILQLGPYLSEINSQLIGASIYLFSGLGSGAFKGYVMVTS